MTVYKFKNLKIFLFDHIVADVVERSFRRVNIVNFNTSPATTTICLRCCCSISRVGVYRRQLTGFFFWEYIFLFYVVKTIENLLALSVRKTGCEKFHSVVVCEWILSVIIYFGEKKKKKGIVASNVGHWCVVSCNLFLKKKKRVKRGGIKITKNNHDEIYLNNNKNVPREAAVTTTN